MNRTIDLSDLDNSLFAARLLAPGDLDGKNHIGRTILGDCFDVFSKIPKSSVDVLILDPPYNLSKKFGDASYSRVPVDQYTIWLRKLFAATVPCLKKTATVYICGDWLSSVSIYTAASESFRIRNRITWEREKGRGALTNWKNASEDVWFCTVSDDYTFNVNAVKIRRRVVAPYRNAEGNPKDWTETSDGNFRDTHPSNLWTDITIPFWSMPENTDHPTQKSEKFLAKLILASSNVQDLVFDPFLGSGTTAVVAKKLGRRFFGVELDRTFALLTEKRLDIAERVKSIQGYDEDIFWERNALAAARNVKPCADLLLPFDKPSK
jgi:site-specific DNA-methyltransferase (adenine-specific)